MDAATPIAPDAGFVHHGTFTLQLAGMNHFEGLVNIYTGENERPEVYIREPAIVKDRIRSKFYQIILDPDGKVCAGTASYPQPESEGDGYVRNHWHEVGSTRSIKGFGFHGALTGAQALMAFLHDPPETFVYADVKAEAKDVIAKFKAAPLKWELFDPPADLVRFFKKTVSVADSKVDQAKIFFRCPFSSLPMMAQHLLNHKESPTIESRGDTLDFQIRLPMINDILLQEIVEHSDFFMNLDPDMGWKDAQKLFRNLMHNWRRAHRPEINYGALQQEHRPLLTPNRAVA